MWAWRTRLALSRLTLSLLILILRSSGQDSVGKSGRYAVDVLFLLEKMEFRALNAYRSFHLPSVVFCFPDCLPGNSDACQNDPFPERKTVLHPLRQERPGRCPPSADHKRSHQRCFCSKRWRCVSGRCAVCAAEPIPAGRDVSAPLMVGSRK